MRVFCRRYLGIGGAFLLIALVFCAFEEKGQTWMWYYGVLYNRTYFLVLYLPLFLLGMVPITVRAFIGEIVIRYPHKFDFVWSLELRILYYAGYVGAVFLLCNLLTVCLYCESWEESGINTWFLLQAFFFQWSGWCLIGNLFLISSLLCRNAAGAYLSCLVFLILITSLGMLGTLSEVDWLIGIYESIYLFFEKTPALRIPFLLYNWMLSVGLTAVSAGILKRKEWLQNEKGVREK